MNVGVNCIPLHCNESQYKLTPLVKGLATRDYFLAMANFNYFWNGPILGSHQPAYSPVQPSVNPVPASTVTEHVNLDLKVLSPMNEKDYRMFVLRHVSAEIDSPCKFRDEIIRQYGETVKLDPDIIDIRHEGGIGNDLANFKKVDDIRVILKSMT